MADFVAKKKPFDTPEWNDQPKRDRTIRALINIIKTRARIGFSAVVVKSVYDEIIVNGKLKDKFGDNHYAFAVRLCTAMVNRWREKHGYAEPVQYVFDRLSKGKGDINALFEKLVTGGQNAMNRYGVFKDCWSFQDKAEVVQLQAADIWAWENYRYMVNCFMPKRVQGLELSAPRLSYLALRSSPCMVKYHVKESLQELARQVPGWAFAAE